MIAKFIGANGLWKFYLTRIQNKLPNSIRFKKINLRLKSFSKNALQCFIKQG